ncbi:MAG: RdgB/HAM1 family non-canonical purine NTP pyrophosphatase [Pseudomonadota bacterium]
MRSLVLASGNAGKLKEFQGLFGDFDVVLRPQSEFFAEEAEETGKTFIENALIKARFASEKSGLPALADDSGLEVQALGGAPGVWSARYAGPDASDADNVAKLLAVMATETDRRAAFYCAIVGVRHPDDPTPLIGTGRWLGEITRSKSGDGGFGYDPVFRVPDVGKTAAELSRDQKQARSHRGAAIRSLLPELSEWVNGAPG